MEEISTTLCIVGGGSGGLSVAAAASQMGVDVMLCEGRAMGGDCLNYGCVPSKALLESAKRFKSIKEMHIFGIDKAQATPNFAAINEHIQEVISAIAPHDSVERFESLGVNVIQQTAHFIDKHTLKAGNIKVKAKYIVLATGSSPAIVPIPGINNVDYLTNESIFSLRVKPSHLVIIGGGPIGCEIADAYAHLGCHVTLIEAAPQILSQADNDCRALIKESLDKAGVTLLENVSVSSVCQVGREIHIDLGDKIIKASHLLMATGRRPNIEQLNLKSVGIKHSSKGIATDRRLRTSLKHIYAIGDIASPYQFTHAAGYHAGIVIQNILFKLPAKTDYASFPWVLYTQLELAHVGLTISEAEKLGAKVLISHYKDNDRAIASGHTDGLIKVAVNKRGRILGVSIVGFNAGELISPWSLAIANKLKIKQMASLIVPYPTLSELSKRAAGSYYTPLLYSKKTKRLVTLLLKWLPF